MYPGVKKVMSSLALWDKGPLRSRTKDRLRSGIGDMSFVYQPKLRANNLLNIAHKRSRINKNRSLCSENVSLRDRCAQRTPDTSGSETTAFKDHCDQRPLRSEKRDEKQRT